jgi:hypothetical protein
LEQHLTGERVRQTSVGNPQQRDRQHAVAVPGRDGRHELSLRAVDADPVAAGQAQLPDGTDKIARALPRTLVDENGQVTFVFYADELAPVPGVQQRGRPVRLRPGQFVEVNHDGGRTQDTEPVILFRWLAQHAGQVFVAGDERVQSGRDRLRDVSQVEPVLLVVRIPRVSDLCNGKQRGPNLRHPGRIGPQRRQPLRMRDAPGP